MPARGSRRGNATHPMSACPSRSFIGSTRCSARAMYTVRSPSRSALPITTSGRHGSMSPPMKIGLIGLPRSGKTSLFNLLTGQSVATSSFGGARAEMHVGVARVPDERLDRLSALHNPKKTTPATFEVVDGAGIEKGERQGLDAKEFRNADAL